MSNQKARYKQLESIKQQFSHGRFSPDQTVFDYQFQNQVGLLEIRVHLPVSSFPASPPTIEVGGDQLRFPQSDFTPPVLVRVCNPAIVLVCRICSLTVEGLVSPRCFRAHFVRC